MPELKKILTSKKLGHYIIGSARSEVFIMNKMTKKCVIICLIKRVQNDDVVCVSDNVFVLT